MADGGRCLSDLPDDLLRHILFLAPDREGASTAVLSRRWRWLWRTSGVVYIDSHSLEHRRSSHKPSKSNRKRMRSPSTGYSAEFLFLRGAEKALAAAQDPIRRLTVFVAQGSEINLTRRCRRRSQEDGSALASDHSLIEAVVSNPAARCVEELRIEVEDVLDTRCTLSFGSLPSEALQVLRIVNCSTLTAAPPPLPGTSTFPLLADLRLHRCNVSLKDLSSTIAAAPQLSTLHLVSSYFFSVLDKTPRDHHKQMVYIQIVSVCYPLLCPAVTALVFADCRVGFADDGYGVPRLKLKLDVPRLQYFRYKGSVELTRRLRLKSYASNNMIQQVDLCMTSDKHEPDPGRRICELFWRFVRRFNTTKLLKLKLDLLMDDVVLRDKAIKNELLGSLSFCRLDQLELEGKYNPGFETSMALLGDLLRYCPVVRDLRLKFSKVELPLAPMRSSVGKEEAGVDIDDDVLEMLEHGNPSVRRWILANKGKKKLDKVGRHAKDIDKLQHDDNYQVYGIHGLTSEHAFSCMQSHLKRVSLDFRMDEPNCLGVKLANFFAENAMVLQEMHVGDCGQELLEHLSPRVRRWMAPNTDKKLDKVGGKD